MRAQAAEVPIYVSEPVAQDYLAHRRGIKAPLNATIWKTILTELAELGPHGISADQALAEAMAAGWRGLKSEWLVNRLKRQQGPGAGPNDDDTSWANNLNEDL